MGRDRLEESFNDNVDSALKQILELESCADYMTHVRSCTKQAYISSMTFTEREDLKSLQICINVLRHEANEMRTHFKKRGRK